MLDSYVPPSWLLALLFSLMLLFLYNKYLHERLWYGSGVQLMDELPALKRRDMTLNDLKVYDGSHDQHICVAVNGNIYDVSSKSHLYGPGGPYGLFAGRDASRCLAKFSTASNLIKDDYDDLSDLTASEMNALTEWTAQFSEMYPRVGRLLGPDEEPDLYTTDEEDSSLPSNNDG